MPVADPKTQFPFSEARIRDWEKPTSGRVRLKDVGGAESCPGLLCYVTPKAKGFYFRTNANGKPVELRLGTWPSITVESARAMVKGDRKTKGIAADPVAAAEARRSIRAESTLAELWGWFTLHHLPTLRASTRHRYEDSWRLHLMPALGSKRLSAIKRSDVQAMADAVVQGGVPRTDKHGNPMRKTGGNGAGRHACAVLSAMFHAAVKDDALAY